MRISKKGNVKLDKGEFRLGNFTISEGEKHHIKVGDIGGLFTVRVSKGICAGQMLSAMIENYKNGEKGSEVFLTNYVTVMFNVLCTVPDFEFLGEVTKSAQDCVNRHKDIYGIKEDISAEEDAKELERVKEVHEATEEVKKEIEG